MSAGELRSLAAEVATDADDLEVARLKLAETADQVEQVKFDLSVVEDAERLDVLVSLPFILTLALILSFSLSFGISLFLSFCPRRNTFRRGL